MVKIKIGLALGGGGANALAHIGVIKVLEKNNIPIDYIAGTSMGAVIAAVYACTKDIEYIEQEVLAKTKLELLALVDLNNPKISLIKGKKIIKFLEKYLKNKTFRKTKIPLVVGATSLDNGNKVIFEKGKIIDAVMHSISYPPVFPSKKYKGKYLVDGGLADPTPVLTVKEMGADVIIGVDLYGISNFKFKDNSAKSVVNRSIQIILSRLLEYKEKEYEDNVIILKPSLRNHLDTFNFLDIKKFIVAGEKEAVKSIKKIKSMIK